LIPVSPDPSIPKSQKPGSVLPLKNEIEIKTVAWDFFARG
jgi:hypothetical protein